MKNIYKKTKLYASVIKKIRLEYGDTFAEDVIDKANAEYWRMQQMLGDAPKGHKNHIDLIIERAALYSVLKGHFPDEAYDRVYEPAHERNVKTNHMIARLTKHKAGARFYLRLMYILGDVAFSEKSGHTKCWRIKEKTCAAFDMLECPYATYTKKLGFPELAKSFCDDDIQVFDNLPNIKYTRPETIGLGGEKCDFRMELKMGANK